MKKTLFTIIALLLSGYTFAQTDTSGRSLYRATPEKKTALKHTKLKFVHHVGIFFGHVVFFVHFLTQVV